MKLISPDYEQEKSVVTSGAHVHDSPLSKLPKKTLSELSLMKSRSRENIARLEVSISKIFHDFFFEKYFMNHLTKIFKESCYKKIFKESFYKNIS